MSDPMKFPENFGCWNTWTLRARFTCPTFRLRKPGVAPFFRGDVLLVLLLEALRQLETEIYLLRGWHLSTPEMKGYRNPPDS